MRVDFQEEILKFILQTKEGKKYAAHLEKELWDSPLNQTLFELYAGYVKQFNGVPSKVTLMEFFDRELKKQKGQKISIEVHKEFERQMYKMYEPFESDTGLIRQEIREYAQRKMTKLLFRENAEKVKDGDAEYFKNLYRDMGRINKLEETLADKEADKRSGLLIAGYEGIKKSTYIKVMPTFLNALNEMTSDGGFFAPQLVLLMGGPKAFKTGTLLNLAVEFVRDGWKVYYADTENGIEAIKRRFYQAMLHCTKQELKEAEQEKTLDRMVKKFKGRNGDIEVGMFAGKTIDDVDAELEYLRDEYNWVPDIIIYDYLKKFKSSNPRISEPRLIIQSVFDDAKKLNVKWGTMALSVAKIKQAAVEKEIITQKDIGDDFEQIYNCDAAFALCRTLEETAQGIARIIPVVQREGEGYTGSQVCMINIEPDRMRIEEIDVKAATEKIKRNRSKLKEALSDD